MRKMRKHVLTRDERGLNCLSLLTGERVSIDHAETARKMHFDGTGRGAEATESSTIPVSGIATRQLFIAAARILRHVRGYKRLLKQRNTIGRKSQGRGTLSPSTCIGSHLGFRASKTSAVLEIFIGAMDPTRETLHFSRMSRNFGKE